MLGAQGNDVLADLLGQAVMPLGPGRTEEARHPFPVEAGGLAIEGALRSAGLLGTFRRRLPEEDDGTDELVDTLLGEGCEQLELLPVVGGCMLWTQSCRHRYPREATDGQ